MKKTVFIFRLCCSEIWVFLIESFVKFGSYCCSSFSHWFSLDQNDSVSKLTGQQFVLSGHGLCRGCPGLFTTDFVLSAGEISCAVLFLPAFDSVSSLRAGLESLRPQDFCFRRSSVSTELHRFPALPLSPAQVLNPCCFWAFILVLSFSYSFCDFAAFHVFYWFLWFLASNQMRERARWPLWNRCKLVKFHEKSLFGSCLGHSWFFPCSFTGSSCASWIWAQSNCASARWLQLGSFGLKCCWCWLDLFPPAP
jgi:hypothetical protein